MLYKYQKRILVITRPVRPRSRRLIKLIKLLGFGAGPLEAGAGAHERPRRASRRIVFYLAQLAW